MILPNGNFIGNRVGVIFSNATQTNAGGAAADSEYTLPYHTFRGLAGLGLIVVDFDKATEATITGLNISVNGSLLPVNSATDEAITTEVAAGLHILVFNKFGNRLQLIV